ncbi:MAG: pseudaminic acid synthase [Acidobacteriota bacterium]
MKTPAIEPVRIGDKLVGPGCPVFIVAEMSANHGQDFDRAVEIVRAAKRAGADAVKVQTYTPDTLTIDADRPEFRHDPGSLWEGKTLYELYQEAYMPWDWQPKLKALAEDLGLIFFSTAYDPTSVDFLAKLDVPAIKISSFELVDTPLIEYAAGVGKPLIISTGMGTLDEIEEAVAAAHRGGCRELILLKCTSAYPAPPGEMNLRTIPALSQRFRCPVGLSDHSTSTLAAIAGTTLGSCLLEKHVTLEKGKGIDGGFSLDPAELGATVSAVRETEAALGAARFEATESERQSLRFRRSLWVVQPVRAGDPITPENVRSIRPSGGLPPSEWEQQKGKPFRTSCAGPMPLREA